jgi:hypothetical protein
MPILNIQNDKFSKNLYKPILKCSNKIFDNLCDNIVDILQDKCNEIGEFTTSIDGNDVLIDNIVVTAEHSRNCRNLITICLFFNETITENEEEKPNCVAKYKVVLDINNYTIKTFANEFKVWEDTTTDSIDSYYFSILQSIISTEIYDAIGNALTELENLNDDIVVSATVLPLGYGTVQISQPSHVIEDSNIQLYEKDEDITVTATANEHYDFSNWTINGKIVATAETYTFKAKEHTTIVANFVKEKYTVTVAEKNDGHSYAILLGSGTFEYGTRVEVFAKPLDGFTFVHWEDENGDEVSTSASYIFTIESNMKLYAVFEQKNTDSQNNGGNGQTPLKPFIPEYDTTDENNNGNDNDEDDGQTFHLDPDYEP